MLLPSKCFIGVGKHNSKSRFIFGGAGLAAIASLLGGALAGASKKRQLDSIQGRQVDGIEDTKMDETEAKSRFLFGTPEMADLMRRRYGHPYLAAGPAYVGPPIAGAALARAASTKTGKSI